MTFHDPHDVKSNTPFGHAMTKGAEHVTVQLHGKATDEPEQMAPIEAPKVVGAAEEQAPEAISQLDRPNADLSPEADKPDEPTGISAA